jgi:hypothetical protein
VVPSGHRTTRIAALITAAALLAPSLSAAAPKTPSRKPASGHRRASGPTAAQIRAAVNRAENSPDLWATINICNTAQFPNYIGVRGQMPALGFTATISMDVGVEYYSIASKKFEQVGSVQHVNLGRSTKGVHQGGVRFPFQAPAAGETYQLRGFITFNWWYRGKLIGSAVHRTKHGQKNVDYSDPPGYSAGICLITAAAH